MSHEIMPGTMLLNRYKINECISSKDFSNIYIAESEETGKKVVIKEILNEAIESKYRDEALKKFKDEIKNYKKLEHENMVKIINCFSSESAISKENKQFIVMEYAKGKTLRQVKEEKKDTLSPEEAGHWIEQLCNFFIYLSEQTPSCLFHYMTPDHIIITDEGKVKMINFGLSRFFRSGPLKSNQYMGIAGYSAPEQYGIKEIDGRTDMFGLGAVIYYLLTEDDPEKHPLNFSPVRQLNPVVSLQLARFVSKCLQMKPEDRFENFTALKEKFKSITLTDTQASSDMVKKKEKEDKKSIIIGSKVLGKEVSGLTQNILWSLEKTLPIRQIIPIVGVILIIGVIASVITYYFLSAPKFPPVLIFATQDEEGYIDVIDQTKKESFKKLQTGKCRGRMLFFNNRIYINGTSSNIIVIDTTIAELAGAINTGGTLLDIVITGDGKAIYGSDTRKGEVVKIDPLAKSVLTSVSVGKAPAGLALSDNDYYLYVANFKSDNISVIDLKTNTVTSTIEKVGTNPKKLLNIPGKKILCSANWGSGDVTFINTANNSIGKKVKVGNQPNDMVLSPDNKKLFVSNRESKSISIINTDTITSSTEINLTDSPYYLGLSPDKKYLLVSMEKNNDILMLDLNTHEIKETISLERPVPSFIMINTQ